MEDGEPSGLDQQTVLLHAGGGEPHARCLRVEAEGLRADRMVDGSLVRVDGKTEYLLVVERPPPDGRLVALSKAGHPPRAGSAPGAVTKVTAMPG